MAERQGGGRSLPRTLPGARPDASSLSAPLVEALARHGVVPVPGVPPWQWLRAALADRGFAYELETATGRLRVVVTDPAGRRARGRAGELPEGLGWALVRLLDPLEA